MKLKAVNFLRQPYPYYFEQINLGKLVLGIFFLSFLFVYLFEPFNVNLQEHRFSYFWISLLHVAVSCLVFFCWYSLVNFLKVEEEQWTVRMEILHLSFVLLLMGLANFFIRDLLYDNPNNWSVFYLFEEVRNTFLVGILLVFLLVPLNFARIYGRNSGKAGSFQTPSEEINPPPINRIFITTQLKSDNFYLQPQNFLFSKAEGNYVEIHVVEEGSVKKLLKRMTIRELESQLTAVPSILKTHRSYLVNLKKVSAVSGNAQGYQLNLQQHSGTVPVSRGQIKKFDEAFATPAL